MTGALVLVAAVVIVVFATGILGTDGPAEAPDAPPGRAGDASAVEEADLGEPAVPPGAPADGGSGAELPAVGPAQGSRSAVRFAREPEATWKVTGVPAGDELNVRARPDTGSPVLVSLPSDAEVDSTGRIAHVDDQLWREIVLWHEILVPGEGVGWVNASYLTRKPSTAGVHYGNEPRANWDVTGVAADDVLNARELPGTESLLVATLAHDATDLESTGRIAHVGESLWRELVVPVGGTAWVNARYLTGTR